MRALRRWMVLMLAGGAWFVAGCAHDNVQPGAAEYSPLPPPSRGHGGFSSRMLPLEQMPIGEDDIPLADKVHRVLAGRELGKAAQGVNIAVRNHVVVLTGSVPTEEDRQAIRSCVQKINGVLAVNDQLSVTAYPETGRPAELRDAAGDKQ